mmetsp:Transcript_5223/g.8630  ORF Transcript_5223/g.8630 Transcript_5223/m.8630 type:complete len:511 (+) Transcript_5223:25-1557(+)
MDRIGASAHGRRVASKKLSSSPYKAAKVKRKSAALSFLDRCTTDKNNTRIACAMALIILLIISLSFMVYVDNRSHSHIPRPSANRVAVNIDLISVQELNHTDYINTARTRNNIASEVLRPLIANTKHDVHVVISTGCSEYQNWQSEVVLYSWARLKHPGQITRIVSGCKNLEQRKAALNTAIISERVHLFFTDDYTPPNKGGGHAFHYFNKPYSMRKFVTEVDIAESVLVLIDPDMIITKVFDYHSAAGEDLQVRRGHPVSQRYGIGAKWVPWKLCTTPSCLKVDDSVAWKHYSVGPPYMMHIEDWRLMVNEWVQYSPAALEHDPPPSILAEMYSFSIACAHHDLPHEIVDTMLSDPDAGGSEPQWKDIEWSFRQQSFLHQSEQDKLDALHVHILHYCHGYWLGDERNTGHMLNYGFNFHKGHLPKDLLHNCDRGLLVEPPTNEYARARDSNKKGNHVWMLYQVITRINNALANYKQLYCGPDWIPTYDIVLRQPEADHTNKMHYYLSDL